MQETYLGKVKMIYIDPPYNTGEDFIYNDNYAVDKDEYLHKSGQQNDERERLVTNPDTNGRFHSDWLSMMLPRLRLARNLLNDDGIIMVSIDDNEVENTRRLLSEVFGERNFVDCMIWKKRYGGGAKEKHLVSLHEYVLVFAREISSLPNIYVDLTEDSIKRYYKMKDDKFPSRGPYRTHPLEATKSMGARPNLIYPIAGPSGVDIYPKRQWLWGRERAKNANAKGELEFIKAKNGDWSVHTKQYLKDEEGIIRRGKAFSMIEDVYTQHGTNELIGLFDDAQLFPFPKPTTLLDKLLQIGLRENEENLVLDFFAGSGSLADAVLRHCTNSNRSVSMISIQLPERTSKESAARRLGYQNIAEISKERIRRAGKKILEENPEQVGKLDVGFRVLKIESSNMTDVWHSPEQVSQDDLLSQVSNIKPDRTAEDLLFQVLLDWGVDLTLPIARESIEGKDVFFVDDNALAACFDTGVSEELVKQIAQRKPLRVVFRDDGFDSDATKINVEQLFKHLSPHTEVKVI